MIFLRDTFTGTDGTLLANHNPDTGDAGSWQALAFNFAQDAADSTNLLIAGNRLRPTLGTASPPTHRNNTPPPANEYDMRFAASFMASPTSQLLWCVFCMHPTNTTHTTVDRYILLLNPGNSSMRLERRIGGVQTVLGTATASPGLPGTVRNFRIEVRDNGLAVYIDDGQILTTDDTAVPRPGRVGFGGRNGDAAQWLDDMVCAAPSLSRWQRGDGILLRPYVKANGQLVQLD